MAFEPAHFLCNAVLLWATKNSYLISESTSFGHAAVTKPVSITGAAEIKSDLVRPQTPRLCQISH